MGTGRAAASRPRAGRRDAVTGHARPELTMPELDRLTEHTSALTEMRGLLPIEPYIKLDTFRVDLLVEQEDRATRRTLRRPVGGFAGSGGSATRRPGRG